MAKNRTAIAPKPELPAWANDLSRDEFVFVTEYLVDLNGTAAVLRIWPDLENSSARSKASDLRNRPHVARALDAAMLESVAGPRQWMVGKLAAIADGDLSEFIMLDEHGVVRLVKPWDKIPKDVKKLFKKMYNGKEGIRIELHDPIKAMELLAKVIPGVVVDQIDIHATVTLEALVLGAMKLKQEKAE